MPDFYKFSMGLGLWALGVNLFLFKEQIRNKYEDLVVDSISTLLGKAKKTIESVIMIIAGRVVISLGFFFNAPNLVVWLY